jgi:hypothetical protein
MIAREDIGGLMGHIGVIHSVFVAPAARRTLAMLAGEKALQCAEGVAVGKGGGTAV